jgi:hypothetical protein
VKFAFISEEKGGLFTIQSDGGILGRRVRGGTKW